jgi:hypothetical protein
MLDLFLIFCFTTIACTVGTLFAWVIIGLLTGPEDK